MPWILTEKGEDFSSIKEKNNLNEFFRGNSNFIEFIFSTFGVFLQVLIVKTINFIKREFVRFFFKLFKEMIFFFGGKNKIGKLRNKN